MTTVGVLAVQGGFGAHRRALERVGAVGRGVRRPADLEGLDGLVLPGGESTVMLRLMEEFGLTAPVRDFVAGGGPVLATCAGLILLAAEVTEPRQRSLGLLDVTVARNAWGRQRESFTALVDLDVDADTAPMEAVFIRAPRIVRIGPSVEILGRLRGEPVLVRSGRITAATFHPELTSDLRLHAAFVGEIASGEAA